jgi:hypothetical protein
MSERADDAGPKLLAGGNPQVPKGEGRRAGVGLHLGDAGWKRDLGARLDALVERAVPGVHKAVKWNEPFYGNDGDGWFVAFRIRLDAHVEHGVVAEGQGPRRPTRRMRPGGYQTSADPSSRRGNGADRTHLAVKPVTSC